MKSHKPGESSLTPTPIFLWNSTTKCIWDCTLANPSSFDCPIYMRLNRYGRHLARCKESEDNDRSRLFSSLSALNDGHDILITQHARVSRLRRHLALTLARVCVDAGMSLEDSGLQRRDATNLRKTTKDLVSRRPTTQGNSSDVTLSPAYLLPVAI